MFEVVIDYGKCTGVLKCVDVCPVEVFEERDDGLASVARGEDCIGCMNCIPACPEKAITVTKAA